MKQKLQWIVDKIRETRKHLGYITPVVFFTNAPMDLVELIMDRKEDCLQYAFWIRTDNGQFQHFPNMLVPLQFYKIDDYPDRKYLFIATFDGENLETNQIVERIYV